jgi:hypothetical protein
LGFGKVSDERNRFKRKAHERLPSELRCKRDKLNANTEEKERSA